MNNYFTDEELKEIKDLRDKKIELILKKLSVEERNEKNRNRNGIETCKVKKLKKNN